jgi:hypothetical protein
LIGIKDLWFLSRSSHEIGRSIRTGERC